MLRTDVLKTFLTRKDVKVVLLMQERRLADYRKEFNHPNITIDAYPRPNANKLELVSWFIARNSIHTYNVRQKQEEFLDKRRERSLRVSKYITARITFALSRFYWFRQIVKKVVALCFDHKVFNDVIEKYKPDLIFAPTIFTTNDIRILKCAKKKGIPTVGMIKSWDNLTGKDPMLIFPDWLIVHNNRIKEEAYAMHKYPRERVLISGIPQLDVFADPKFPRSREEHVRKMGLDPNKKTLLYTAMGSWIVIHEAEMIEILADIVKNKLPYPAQLVVRLHPAYVSEDEKLKNIPGIILDRPGGSNFQFNSWRADWEFEIEDTRHLVETIMYSDVVINSGSTTTIDAACLNKPIINVNFDGYMGNKEIQARSVRRLLVKEHYKPIIATGGVKLVDSLEELVEAVKGYIADPKKDENGRKKLVEDQCYKLDGKSGKRIGEFVLNKLLKS
jgi:hypothetical protein